jgi:ABC-2 type transport system permease protein
VIVMPVFDQGYQHWSGELSSHSWRWLAITRRGVRNALQSRIIRLFLLAAWVPALALAFVLCMWGLVERQSVLVESIKPLLTSLLGRPILAGPRDYRVEVWTICFHYFLSWELWFSMVLVLVVGPTLISQDLRYNALPLYLSRPLRRVDYFVGKLGVIVSLLGMVIVLPAAMAYALGLLFSLDITIVRDTLGILIGSVVYGLVIAISAGLLMLALSSLSRNSRYVALMWMGLWIITSTVSLILTQVAQVQRMHESGTHPGMWASEETVASEIEAARSDWRPLVSYTANLRRIGERLLGTNTAWERLSQLSPAGQRGPIMMQMVSSQFPWYWSAAVLLALFGFSAWILHYSVKSLDRLK